MSKLQCDIDIHVREMKRNRKRNEYVDEDGEGDLFQFSVNITEMRGVHDKRNEVKMLNKKQV